MNESTPAKTKEHNLAFLFTAYLLTNNKLSWRSLLGILSLLSSVIFCSNTAAQIVPDNTLGAESSTVKSDNLNGQAIDLIEGGATRDTNLFHSFAEFNIAAEKGAYFANPEGINNIFSRVTGSNPSQILGTLGVLGNSNLFLINPNGIVFGKNARLDVGGSFFASTADSLLFDNGFEYSGSNPEAPPLLTVNIPIGLGFRDNPGDIVNRSFAQNSKGERVGLEVLPGKNLTLVGGNINFEAGEATARGGNIQLGGLSAAGTVGISEDGSLNFPEDVAKADITLSNAADADVRGAGGGSITVNAGNLNLEAGEQGSSFIGAGITADSTSADAQAGDIRINATDNVTIDDSFIANQVNSEAVGNAGDVTIDTESLSLTNGGRVDASTFGRGNAGKVEITASDTITFDGEDSEGIASGATSGVGSEAVGDAGGVTIKTGSLNLTNGGRVSVSTFGEGNAGSVQITATDSITIDGEDSEGFVSGATSLVNPGAVGDAGGVTIKTDSLTLTNGGRVDASTFGEGDAGSVKITASDITIDGEDSDGSPGGVGSSVGMEALGDAGDVNINTGVLSLTNGGRVDASTSGQGDAGTVQITANDITIDGEGLDGGRSGVTSRVFSEALGDAGGVNIDTASLSLINGGGVDTSTLGRGNAGSVKITAKDTITIDGEDLDGSPTGVSSSVGMEALGDAGDVTINTGFLSLTRGGGVDASTSGQGDAGTVQITANDITIDGEGLDGGRSGVTSRVFSEALGDAGGVTINTDSLSLINGGGVDASTLGRGNAGSVKITAKDTITIDGEGLDGFVSNASSAVAPGAEGNAGGVTIDTGSLTLTKGGRVIADTFGQGNAGQVTIKASDTITIDGEDSEGFPSGVSSSVNSVAEGDAGGITIDTGSLSLTNGGRVIASTFGRGDAGTVEITASDTITIDGENSGGFLSTVYSQVASEKAEGNAGGITIDTGSLFLTNGGEVSASTFGQGNAGKVEITASDTITIDGENSAGFPSAVYSLVNSDAEGNAGGITIDTASLSLTNGGEVSASTFGQGNAGKVEITASDTITINGENSEGFSSQASSSVSEEAKGNARGVTIATGSLSLTNGGQVAANTFSQGNAGSVEITATDTITIDGEESDGSDNSGVTSFVNPKAEGDAGGVTIDAGSLSLTNGGRVIVDTFGRGNAGTVKITASDITIDGEDSDGFGSGATSLVNPGAVGDAGGVTIATGSLSLTNGGQVAANTFGQGNAGAVEITATDTITIDGETSDGSNSGATSGVNSGAVGDAGGVTITTGSLNLTNGGRVDANTLGQGNAGSVEITATDTITIDGEDSEGIPSGVTSLVNPGAVGNAGGVTIKTGSLELTNGGRVDASTLGQGNAGAVEITATDTITFDGETSDGSNSGATSAVNPGAVGNAGGVTITTGSLSLTNGGRVIADTFGRGNAGTVNITASDITIDGEKSDGFPSEVSSSVNLEAEGNAGGVNVDTSSLSLTNGGRVIAETLGEGNAGDVTVNARESITISGATETESFRSGISADAFVSSGNGGDVNVSTNQLTIDDGGSIEAGNFDSLGVFDPGTGQPGNINIEANSISLNRGRIEATTQSDVGEAANINLTIAEDIFFKNNSLISARASGNANGGNVTINADRGSIVAFPNQNNDIVANAQQGNGGNINITTQGIFGLEERRSEPRNQTNDIDASSQFGLQGTFSLNTPENEPIRGLIDLPKNVVNPEDLINQNACKQGANSKFIVTGKGGLPATPEQMHYSDEVEVGLVKPATGTAAVIKEPPVAEDETKMVPAKGWIRNEKGEIFLVGYDPTVSNILPQPENLDWCQPRGDD